MTPIGSLESIQKFRALCDALGFSRLSTWEYQTPADPAAWDVFGWYLTEPGGRCWQFPTRGPSGPPDDGEILDGDVAMTAALRSLGCS